MEELKKLPENLTEKNALINAPENAPQNIIPKRKDSRLLPLEAKRGKMAVQYLKIAQMAVRGFSMEQIADEVKVPVARVSKLLRTNNQIWDFISRAIQETFSEGDRILAYLYKKSMMSLDDELSSPSPDIRQKARSQIFEMLKAMQMTRGSAEEGGGQDNRSIIFNQFFGSSKVASGSKIKSMDDLILQKRRERGLETEAELVQSEEEIVEDEDEEIEEEDAIKEVEEVEPSTSNK
jgi:hypothetical protein